MSDADVLTAALDATDESTQATATAPGQCAPTHPRNPKAELIAIADSAPRGLATDTDDPNEVTASASISGSAQVLDSTSGSEQTGATSSATSSASASATPRKQFDTDFLRSVTWDDVVVINGELKTIGCVSIEDFKSKDLRTCCSTLRIKGVKNAQKYKMVERITESKHKKMGIVAVVKAPHSIVVEAQARKRARLDKISEIAEVVKGQQLQQQQQHYGAGGEGDGARRHTLDQQKLQFWTRREEREEEKHQVELEKMKIEMQNTLIDSYSKLMSCIGVGVGVGVGQEATSCDVAVDSLLQDEVQQDISALVDLKGSVAKRLFAFAFQEEHERTSQDQKYEGQVQDQDQEGVGGGTSRQGGQSVNEDDLVGV